MVPAQGGLYFILGQGINEEEAQSTRTPAANGKPLTLVGGNRWRGHGRLAAVNAPLLSSSGSSGGER